jgi:hypothetical protein
MALLVLFPIELTAIMQWLFLLSSQQWGHMYFSAEPGVRDKKRNKSHIC